jgi:putative membrane protein
MTTRRRAILMSAPLWLMGAVGAVFAQNTAAPASNDSKTASRDTMFMRHAAADSLAEIAMARIALGKSSTTQVKQLAQRIIDDHTSANDRLMTLAERKQVTLPTEPMPMAKQEAARLDAMNGPAFDQAYARNMVKDHRKAIKMFGIESKEAGDSGLRQFASTTLPVLKTHLQMATQLAGDRGQGGGNPPMRTPVSSGSTH